ncbi:MAG TPA: hypothetical protein DEQ14_07670, partial [Treponema sp.]|nr:hypothetical protein [Treponema sp.]
AIIDFSKTQNRNCLQNFPHSKRNAKMTPRQRTANSPVPIPYSPNWGIAQAACGWSVRGADGGRGYVHVAVWKQPLFLNATNVWSFRGAKTPELSGKAG